jgi:hypothetical protein
MATGTVTRNANGIANRAVGKFTGDGTALSVTMGFKPMLVRIFNATDATTWEKMNDMPDTTTVKTVTAGTVTTDTTSAIVLTDRGFITSAALAANGKVCYWVAE